jgi:hypothetical protein
LPWNAAGDLERLLGEWRPDLVVTSTTYKEMERAALTYAQDHGIASCQLVDSHYNYSGRLQETNGAAILPDRVLLLDPIAVLEAVAEGLPEDRLSAVGNPAWEEMTLAPPERESCALFASQPIAADMNNRLGYTECSALELALTAADHRPDLIERILLAPHPREDGTAAHTHPCLRRIDSAKLGLRQAGTVLGMFSSVLIEAVLAGRRVISLQPRAQGMDMCMLSRHGMISRALNLGDLIAAMSGPPPSVDDLRLWYAESTNRVDTSIRSMI